MIQLNEPTYIDYTKLKVRKVNKMRKVFGNTTFHLDLDNTCMVEGLIYVKQGGEYRLMPYKLNKKGICDLHNDDKFFYPELWEVSDWKNPCPCPIPKVNALDRKKFFF